jgi:hypothetical protein
MLKDLLGPIITSAARQPTLRDHLPSAFTSYRNYLFDYRSEFRCRPGSISLFSYLFNKGNTNVHMNLNMTVTLDIGQGNDKVLIVRTRVRRRF